MSDFVKALYQANPNANKTPTLEQIAGWEEFRRKHGDTVTTNTFNLSVAEVTGTPVWSPPRTGTASVVAGRLGGLLPLLLVGGVVLWIVIRRRKGKK